MRTPALSRYSVRVRSRTRPGASSGTLWLTSANTSSTFEASSSPRISQTGTECSLRVTTITRSEVPSTLSSSPTTGPATVSPISRRAGATRPPRRRNRRAPAPGAPSAWHPAVEVSRRPPRVFSMGRVCPSAGRVGRLAPARSPQTKGRALQKSIDRTREAVRITVPALLEYVRIVRLTSSGVANHLGFDVEEVEDLRVAVDELASLVLDKALDGNLDITFCVEDEFLRIEGHGAGGGRVQPGHRGTDRADPRGGRRRLRRLHGRRTRPLLVRAAPARDLTWPCPPKSAPRCARNSSSTSTTRAGASATS